MYQILIYLLNIVISLPILYMVTFLFAWGKVAHAVSTFISYVILILIWTVIRRKNLDNPKEWFKLNLVISIAYPIFSSIILSIIFLS
jgi:hypothetical protein